MKIKTFFKTLFLSTFIFFSFNTFASNIYVNNAGTMDGTEIYCSNPGNDIGAVSSKSAPFATLKYALSKANSGDVIFVDAGDYKEKTLIISKSNITIIGAGTLVTNFHPASPGISGNFFMKIIGVSAGATIDNIIVKNLNIYGYNNVTSGEGEALTIGNVHNLLFDYCTFGKSAGGSGEAVINVQSNSMNVVFKHIGFLCQTQGSAGGGVDIGSTNVDVLIDSSVVGSNDRTSGVSWTRGAGVYIHGDATVSVKINNSSITTNTAQIGGGVYVSGGILTMNKSCISNNSSLTNSADYGGGVTITGTSGLCTFTDCDFLNNSITASKGGGIAAYSLNAKIDLALISCTFSGNKASGNSGTDLYTKQVFGKVVNVTATDCAFNSSGTAIYNASGNVTINKSGNPTVFGTIGGDLLAKTTITNTNCPVVNSCESPCDPIDSIVGKKTICNTKTTLTVYGNPQATFYWYATIGASVPFHIGKMYTTSILTKDTTFYVNSSLSGPSCYEVVTIKQDCKCNTVISNDTTICIGSVIQLKAWTDNAKTIASTPNNSNPWISSDSLVASITKTGILTGLKSGKVIVTYTDNNNCVKTDTITVLAKPIGGIATPDEDTICENTTATIRLNGYTGAIQWQESPDGVKNWKNLLNANSTPYITNTLSKIGTYYYRAKVSNILCNQNDTSNVVIITVTPTSDAGTAKAIPDTLCAGNSSILTLSGYTGKIQWQESVDGTTGWKNIVAATGDTTKSCTTAKLFVTTYYKALVKSGPCPAVESAILKVVVNPILRDSLDIKSDHPSETQLTKTRSIITVCPDSKVKYTASTFNTSCGGITYQWKNGKNTIVGETNSTYVKTAVDLDSIYCVMTVTGKCCYMFPIFYSDTIITKEVKNDFNAKLCQTPSACGVCDGEICLEGTGTGDVSWAGPSSGTKPNSTLTIPSTTKISGLCKGTYLVSYTNNTCVFTKTVTLSDPNAPNEPVITYVNDSVCEGSTLTLTATGVTASGTLTYVWYKDGAVIPGETSNKLIINVVLAVPGVNEVHKYAVKAVDNGCSSNVDSVIIVYISTPAVPTTISSKLTFCKSDLKKVSDLTLLISNISGTINWFDALIGGNKFNNSDLLVSGTYYAEQTNGICNSSSRLKVDVIINDVVAPTIPEAPKDPTCNQKTGSVRIDLPSAGVWEVTATPLIGNSTTVQTGNLTTPPFTFSFLGLLPGTYTFVCKDQKGCTSPKSAVVTIKTPPTIPQTPKISPDSIYCSSSTYKLVDIVFKPKLIGTIKYYDVLGDSISSSTVVLPNTHYKISIFDGTCESKKLDTIIKFNDGPTIIPIDLTSKVFCASDKPTFNAFVQNLPVQPKGYTIYFSPNKNGNPIIPNGTEIGAVDELNHTIYYAIKDTNGCYNPNFEPLVYKINLGPANFKLKSEIVYFCAKNNPKVADLDATKISGNGKLTWYIDQNSIVSLPKNTLLTNGVYFASLTDTITGCSTLERQSVIVNIESFGQTTLDPKNNYTFCLGDNLTTADLPTLPYNNLNLVWLNQNKIQINANTQLIPGIYYAAEFKNGCASDKIQEIEVVFSQPKIALSPDKLPTCELGFGIFKVVGANPTYTYQWYKDGLLMNESGSSIMGLPDNKNSKYTVKVTDANGCSTSKTESFDDCEPAKPPHIFTPDGNGKNDKFILNYATKYPNCKLYIYNRWGSLVYESLIPYTDSWDGKSNIGSAFGDGLLPAATYFYLIDKGDGTASESGFVELVK